jgi:hypothetical protein
MIEIIRYSALQKTTWQDVLSNSLNGTFLHSREFFDHNPLNKLDDCSFLYLKKNKGIGIVPCTLYEKHGKRILNSHLRSTYGGFVVTKEVGVDEAVEMVEKLISQARMLGVNEIVIRNPFRIFHKAICDDTDYAMWYHGFTIRSRELETAIPLGDYAAVLGQFDSSTLRSIKKSRQHISVMQTDDYETYWQLLTDNLSKNHGVKPTHEYEEFVLLLENIGLEKVKLFGGYKEGHLVAGVVVFVLNEQSLHAQYIASNNQFQEFRPLNAIIDEIIRWGSEQQFSVLNLGTSNTDAGKGINSGLFRFKQGFGGRNTLRETMHLSI